MPFSGSLSIEVENVSMSFGKTVAVDDVSLEIEKGTIFGLVGSDGAGKSTLLRMIAGMIRPCKGSITVSKIDVAADLWKAKPLIGYMPQRFGLYQDLTVEENIDFFMDIFGISGDERRSRKEKYLGFSNLLPFLNRLAGNLSGGMKQKLGLACVLIHEPSVLILDEPTNGVDPVSRGEFWDILLAMREGGMTIMVSTAYLDEGEKCDRLGLMHKSHLLAVASPSEMRSRFATLEDAMIHRIKEVDKEIAHDTFKR
ncbi:MAG TPA: ABC transporter ATP-binding protein [Deltaproteobacteria bacterium]|jgi:ABC-2 type transport system ATP-binding protein|nr:ABC transporter ATP-binding protein [Deltaproteobacteria bacterium]HQJ07437.1 ABC transporter ATP-binding protein [Deltaproteobacteria bacterium]